MQIFEVTAVSSGAANFLGGFGAGLASSGGAAGQVGQAIASAANTEPTQGGSLEAGAVNQSMAQPLATQLTKAWNDTVTKWMTKYQVPSVASGNLTQQTALKAELATLINRVMSGRGRAQNYRQLPAQVAKDTATQGVANKVVDQIDTALDTIFDATAGTIKADVKAAFLSLAREGIVPALNMMQFNAGTPAQAAGRVAPQLAQDAQEITRAAGMSAADVANLQSFMGREYARDPAKALELLKQIAGIQTRP